MAERVLGDDRRTKTSRRQITVPGEDHAADVHYGYAWLGARLYGHVMIAFGQLDRTIVRRIICWKMAGLDHGKLQRLSTDPPPQLERRPNDRRNLAALRLRIYQPSLHRTSTRASRLDWVQ